MPVIILAYQILCLYFISVFRAVKTASIILHISSAIQYHRMNGIRIPSTQSLRTPSHPHPTLAKDNPYPNHKVNAFTYPQPPRKKKHYMYSTLLHTGRILSTLCFLFFPLFSTSPGQSCVFKDMIYVYI